MSDMVRNIKGITYSCHMSYGKQTIIPFSYPNNLTIKLLNLNRTSTT